MLSISIKKGIYLLSTVFQTNEWYFFFLRSYRHQTGFVYLSYYVQHKEYEVFVLEKILSKIKQSAHELRHSEVGTSQKTY